MLSNSSQLVSGEYGTAGSQDNTQRDRHTHRRYSVESCTKVALHSRLLQSNIKGEVYPILVLPNCDQQQLSCKCTRNLHVSSWPKAGWGWMQQEHFQTILLMHLLVRLFSCQGHTDTPIGGASRSRKAVEMCQMFSSSISKTKGHPHNSLSKEDFFSLIIDFGFLL